MDELRAEIGVNESVKKILMRSRFKFGGHMERIGDENLAKISDVQKLEDKRKRRREGLRWEDYVNRYLERVRGEWRTTTKDRRREILIENAVREK